MGAGSDLHSKQKGVSSDVSPSSAVGLSCELSRCYAAAHPLRGTTSTSQKHGLLPLFVSSLSAEHVFLLNNNMPMLLH
jgi:hypothetical protein